MKIILAVFLLTACGPSTTSSDKTKTDTTTATTPATTDGISNDTSVKTADQNVPVNPGDSQTKPPMKDSTINTRVNQTFEIKLPVIMGTGFRWELGDSLDKKFLAVQSLKFNEEDDSMPGHGGTQVYTIKALSAGTSSIRLIHIQPWDPKSKNNERTYNVVIK